MISEIFKGTALKCLQITYCAMIKDTYKIFTNEFARTKQKFILHYQCLAVIKCLQIAYKEIAYKELVVLLIEKFVTLLFGWSTVDALYS